MASKRSIFMVRTQARSLPGPVFLFKYLTKILGSCQ
jgi:hypothetical protein